MSLSDLVRAPQILPPRLVVYGPEGVGKTTFAAAAPAPVFLGCEDGMGVLKCPTIPIRKWRDLEDALTALLNEPHSFRTVVLDTADWLTRLLEAFLCERKGVDNVEDLGAYGKGAMMISDEWTRRLIPTLDRLRDERGMTVIVLAHADAVTVKNPEGTDYTMTDLRLPKRVAAGLREWADAVMLADWEVRVSTASRDPKPGERGKMTLGARVLATQRGSGWMAKNRYSLPPEMPLEWATFAKSLPVAGAKPDPLAESKAKLRELVAQIGTQAAIDAVEKGIANPELGAKWYTTQIAKLEKGIAEAKAKAAQPAPDENPDAEPAEGAA